MKIITDVQQARAIIGSVGEQYQKDVVDKLRSTYWDIDGEAANVLMDIERKYVLATASKLWTDKFDRIPQYIKDYNK